MPPSAVRAPAVVIACLLAILASPVIAQPEGVSIGSPSPWVEERPLDLAMSSPPEAAQFGGHYLLLDFQDDLRRHESYFRQAVRILSQEGVSSFSDVLASFDPREGSLTFHHVRVHRDGAVLDRLEAGEIRSYQRENRLEYGIYDGLETAVINLHDVRPGDVVDFAYTVHGVQPLLDGHVAESYAQRSGTAIGGLWLRLITEPTLRVRQHVFHGGEEFAVSDGPHAREYTWRGRDLPALLLDDAVPSWWDPAPRVSLTSFADWRAVVDWALPLYRLDPADRTAVAELVAGLPGGDELPERVLAAVRFVQDEVRYLGREEGLWALKPRPPARCLERRFGDCKDKSLLLVALLRELGLEAFPLLVSTVLGEHVADAAPSPLAFDHCVVGFDLAGARLYVDPTLDHQGGGLGHHHFPDFRRGLPVAEEADGLIELPGAPPLSIEIDERFEVPTVGSGDVVFRVDTTYRGQAADLRRAAFAGANPTDLGQSFTRYYSAAYPGIEQASPVRWTDEDRETANALVVSEHYLIRDAWSLARDDSSLTYFEVYPLELETFVDLFPSPARTAPYDPGSRVDLSIHSLLQMPEEWPVAIAPVVVAGEGYAFEHEVSSERDQVEISYRYRRGLRTVAAEDTPAFLADHDEMMNQLGISVFDRLPAAGFEASPTAVLLVTLMLLGGGVGAFFVWRLYDPEPAVPPDAATGPRGLGGWLVLPTISFTITPIVLVVRHYASPELFDRGVWSLADQGLIDQSALAWQALLGFEAVGNAAMLVMSLLVLAFFFGRRSGAPRLIIAFLVGSAFFVTLDAVLSIQVLGGDGDDPGTTADAARSWIGVAIWVPYFLRSQRVRRTFVRRAPGRREPAPLPAVEVPPP